MNLELIPKGPLNLELVEADQFEFSWDKVNVRQTLNNNEWCLRELKKGREITPAIALQEANCWRLGSVIDRLKNGKHDGILHNIENVQKERGVNFGIYRLIL